MKNLFFLFLSVSLLNVAAFANDSESAKEVYEALDVEEVNVNPGILGSYRLVKSVGELTCVKSRLVVPNAEEQYGCTLKEENDAEAIYNALNVEEVHANPRSLGVFTLVKSAGNLLCSKARVVYPGAKAKYSCTLN